MFGRPSLVQLAREIRESRDMDAARELARRILAGEGCGTGPVVDDLPAFIARSGLAGKLTTEIFDVLADAFADERAAREIRGLPERAA